MSQQINLFNPVFLKQKKYFSVITMLQALGLIVLGSLLFYGYALYQVAQLSKQSEEMGKRYVAEQARLAKFNSEFSPQRAGQLLEEEQKQLEAQVAAQEKLPLPSYRAMKNLLVAVVSVSVVVPNTALVWKEPVI